MWTEPGGLRNGLYSRVLRGGVASGDLVCAEGTQAVAGAVGEE